MHETLNMIHYVLLSKILIIFNESYLMSMSSSPIVFVSISYYRRRHKQCFLNKPHKHIYVAEDKCKYSWKRRTRTCEG